MRLNIAAAAYGAIIDALPPVPVTAPPLHSPRPCSSASRLSTSSWCAMPSRCCPAARAGRSVTTTGPSPRRATGRGGAGERARAVPAPRHLLVTLCACGGDRGADRAAADDEGQSAARIPRTAPHQRAARRLAGAAAASVEQPDYRLPGAESSREAQERVRSQLDLLRSRHAAGGTVLVGSHGNLISLLLATLEDGIDYHFTRRCRCPPSTTSSTMGSAGA